MFSLTAHGRPLGWRVARLSCSSWSTISPAATATLDRRNSFISQVQPGRKAATTSKRCVYVASKPCSLAVKDLSSISFTLNTLYEF